MEKGKLWGRGKPFLLAGLQPGWPLSLQSSSGQLWPSHPWYRMLWEEFLVAAFEDIHLRVVQAGVVVSCTVPFPDKPAPRAAWEGVQGRIHMSERDSCPYMLL